MIVRLADFDKATDAAGIMHGARRFIAELDCVDFLPHDDDTLADALARVASLPGFELALADLDGDIVGGLAVLFGPFLWNPKLLSVSEMFFWVAPEAPKITALRLLRFIDERTKLHGATVREFFSLRSSPPTVAQLYERMGMVKVQTGFIGKVH